MVKSLDRLQFKPLENARSGDMLSWGDADDDANAPAFVLVPPTVLCCDGILGQEVSWDDCLWGTINLTEPA
jgi:hypothetical protein